jgi:hypothetical protein
LHNAVDVPDLIYMNLRAGLTQPSHDQVATLLVFGSERQPRPAAARVRTNLTEFVQACEHAGWIQSWLHSSTELG